MPVFNEDNQEYKSHMKIETNYQNCQIMYNTGLAPTLSHTGNLAVEAINSQINSYVAYHFIFNLTSNYLDFILVLVFIIHHSH